MMDSRLVNKQASIGEDKHRKMPVDERTQWPVRDEGKCKGYGNLDGVTGEDRAKIKAVYKLRSMAFSLDRAGLKPTQHRHDAFYLMTATVLAWV